MSAGTIRNLAFPIVAAVTLVSFACVGCASSAERTSQSSGGHPRARLTVTTWRNGDKGMLALGGGRLIIGRDGCIGLQRLDRSGQFLLRWPAGTTLSPDGRAVVGGQHGTRMAFGSVVSLGGGFGGAKVPSYCDSALWSATFEVQQPL